MGRHASVLEVDPTVLHPLLDQCPFQRFHIAFDAATKST